jgi:hypothetical protein
VEELPVNELRSRLLAVEAENFRLTEAMHSITLERVCVWIVFAFHARVMAASHVFQDRATTSCEEVQERITELELELAQAKLKLAQYEARIARCFVEFCGVYSSAHARCVECAGSESDIVREECTAFELVGLCAVTHPEIQYQYCFTIPKDSVNSMKPLLGFTKGCYFRFLTGPPSRLGFLWSCVRFLLTFALIWVNRVPNDVLFATSSDSFPLAGLPLEATSAEHHELQRRQVAMSRWETGQPLLFLDGFNTMPLEW